MKLWKAPLFLCMAVLIVIFAVLALGGCATASGAPHRPAGPQRPADKISAPWGFHGCSLCRTQTAYPLIRFRFVW